MRTGYLEDMVQAHEIIVTRVFTSCVHSSPGDPGPELEGWRGLAFLRGMRGSGLGFQELWTAGSLGLGGTLGSRLPQPHFGTSPHVSPQHPHLLLAACCAQECGGSHTTGGSSCAP